MGLNPGNLLKYFLFYFTEWNIYLKIVVNFSKVRKQKEYKAEAKAVYRWVGILYRLNFWKHIMFMKTLGPDSMQNFWKELYGKIQAWKNIIHF